MTASGGFSRRCREGDQVIKLLAAQHPSTERVVASAVASGRAGMERYLDVLRAHGVALPQELMVISDVPLAVRHRWVEGSTLPELAARSPGDFVASIAQVAAWVHMVSSTDARIDTNLANFCLTGDDLVLVDVLPPLRPSCAPAPPYTLFETLFCVLCFDTEVILDALIGYAARTMLRADPSQQVRHALAELSRVLRPSLVTGQVAGFPASWFRARACLALGALDGEVPTAVLYDFFADTSVLAFRQLDEIHRQRHLHKVDELIATLDLP